MKMRIFAAQVAGLCLGAEDRETVEAYLMAKWLGVVGAGYSDLRRATVTGAGTVDAAATPQVADAVVVPGQLTVPATGTVTVSITDKARPGTYPLVTCGSIAGDGFDGWTLAQPEGVKGRLVATETGVAYVLAPTGTFL